MEEVKSGGSRGEADRASDIGFLTITSDQEAKKTVNNIFGSTRIETSDGNKISMTKTYSIEEYRHSLSQDSSFLENIQDELHTIYDPNKTLTTKKSDQQ